MQMDNEMLYLRADVQVEPLVDRWYAWPHLIPPWTAARNLTERHLKIMDSYINAPQIHASAVRNPKMLGGPFIDYEGARVDEIKALRDQTKRDRRQLMELSTAIAELDAMLSSNAKGFSMADLYPLVPNALRGYVELVYDLRNRPTFRLIESLLFKSHFYSRSAQSLLLSAIKGDDRPFVLSTPRLDSEDSVHLGVPFDDPVIDKLFELKTVPDSWSSISTMFDPAHKPANALRRFFSADAPAQYRRYTDKGVRWRYFGHACILIETGGVSLLSDPVLSYTYDSSVSRYTYQDLPDYIDYIIITHNHQDHILFETLLQLRHKIGTIIVPKSSGGDLQDPSVRLILENTGFKNVKELGEMEEFRFEGVSITGLPFLGEHADLDVRSKLAYLVQIRRHKLLFAADSCNVEPMVYEYIHRDVGDVDALFVGMECDGAPLSWLYGPLLTQTIERRMDESRRLAGSNYEQAMDIVSRFHCKEVYVYAMGQEPWLNYIMSLKYTDQSRPIVESNRLIDSCRAKGIVAERLYGEKEILLAP